MKYTYEKQLKKLILAKHHSFLSYLFVYLRNTGFLMFTFVANYGDIIAQYHLFFDDKESCCD